MVEMELVDIQVERTTNIPYILLRAGDGSGRVLPILTRPPEADAIKFGMQATPMPRPMTHDLLIALLGSCAASVARVVITEVRSRVFYADLVLSVGGRETTVSSRPSDAIAIAVRAKAPIFATAALLDEVGVQPSELLGVEDVGPVEPEEQEELVDEFRKFIDDINPEDFGA